MKKTIILLFIGLSAYGLMAQDTSAVAQAARLKPVKNTFDGNYIIDNQTVMVPNKGVLEFGIQHRFGTVGNGISDMGGLWAGADIRFSLAYTPINNLQIGAGVTENNYLIDGNVKWAIVKQSREGGCPVSVTYFGNMASSMIPAYGNFANNNDRLSYFNQLIIARKFSSKLSIQVSPSLSHFNNVAGYINAEGGVSPLMNNDHWAIAFSGRY